MKNWKNKLTKKVFPCPSCKQQLRLPIRPGKVLRVTCRNCQCQFDVSFKSPLVDLFKWQKGFSFQHNMKTMGYRWKALPMNGKASIVLSFFLFYMVGALIISFLSSMVSPEQGTVIDPSQNLEDQLRTI